MITPKKILAALMIGGFLTMTTTGEIEAAKNSAHEINFYGARNLTEILICKI